MVFKPKLKYACNPEFAEDCTERLQNGSCDFEGNCSQKGIIEENKWGKIWTKINQPQPFWPLPEGVKLTVKIEKSTK